MSASPCNGSAAFLALRLHIAQLDDAEIAKVLGVSPAPSHAPSCYVKPEPIGSVWPEALREVPAKTPDGEKIQPILLRDDRTLLVSTWASFEKTDALYAYDLDTLALREITHRGAPQGDRAVRVGLRRRRRPARDRRHEDQVRMAASSASTCLFQSFLTARHDSSSAPARQ